MKILLALLLLTGSLPAQVTSGRILNANREPQNWLTYSASYIGPPRSRNHKFVIDLILSSRQKWSRVKGSVVSFRRVAVQIRKAVPSYQALILEVFPDVIE
jgi:hypothetical protein